MAASYQLTVGGIRHPDYLFDQVQWEEWRDTFAGGENYLQRYLHRFSDRETVEEFSERKALSPIPAFAKSALLDVRNSIYQRLVDVTRVGGSDFYQRAVTGESGGVDRKGTDMNSFVGIDALTELLVMGRVGIFVDAPAYVPAYGQAEANPYLYIYCVEDILSWTEEDPDKPGQFKAVLLRDHCVQYNSEFGGIALPAGPKKKRLRLLWKDEVTGYVKYRMYDEDEKPVVGDDAEDPQGTVTLEGITIIPFVMPCIGDSLLKDVASYQKTLLNLLSRSVAYDLRANSPFLTIQAERQTAGHYLKQPGRNPASGGQAPEDPQETIGGGKGRYYDKDMERPGYVAPPTEPLLASLQLQAKLEDDIRRIINLAVASKAGSRTESAEAKKLGSQGLEAGLSHIGLVLQTAERRIAEMWAAYENYKKPEPSRVSYPSRYILKTDEERIEEAKGLLALIDDLPTETAKREMAKQIITLLLGQKVDAETLLKMHAEVDASGYTSANLERLTLALENNLVSKETASRSMGYKEGEVEKAKKDQEHDATITVLAQTKAAGAAPGQPALAGALPNPGARGVPGVPNNGAAAAEQAAGREE